MTTDLNILNAQCNTLQLQLRAGEPVIEDCYRAKVPIYFAYGGSGSAPATFSICSLVVEGEFTNAKIVGTEIVDGFTDITNDASKFTASIPDDLGEVVEFELDGRDAEHPHLYITVETVPDAEFGLWLSGSEFYFEDSGSPGTCGGSSCDFDDRIFYDADPMEGPSTMSCAPSTPELKLFIDEANIDYDGQEATVPVKILRVGSTGSVSLSRLDFSLDEGDVFDNLLANTPVLTATIALADFAFDPQTGKVKGNLIGISLSFTNDGMGNGISPLFTFKIYAPDDPLAGGKANLSFDYARAQFSGGDCCSPATLGGTVDVATYPYPCVAVSPETEAPGVRIGTADVADATITFPVSLEGDELQIYSSKAFEIRITVTTSGQLHLDESAMLSSLAFCPTPIDDPNQCALGASGECLGVDEETGEIIYRYCFNFDQGLSMGIDLFDIVLSGGCGCVENIKVSISELSRFGYTTCVPLVEHNYTLNDACTVKQEGKVIFGCDDETPVSGVNICARLSTASGDLCSCTETCDFSDVSDSEGVFEFPECFDEGKEYIVSACKTDDILCGLTTFDQVLITRHILSTVPLDGFNEIAADLNGVDGITNQDIILLRKLILFPGEIDFPAQSAPWRFLPCGFDDEMISQWPVCLDLKEPYETLLPCFHAIKMGDVNCSCPNEIQAEAPEGELVIHLNTGTGSNINYIEAEFEPEDFEDIVAFQFGLRFNRTKLAFDEYAAADLVHVDSTIFGLSEIEDGIMRVAWYDTGDTARTLSSGDLLFRIGWDQEITNTAELSDIWLDTTLMLARAYLEDGTPLSIRLEVDAEPLTQRPVDGTTTAQRLSDTAIKVKPCTEDNEACLEMTASAPMDALLSVFDASGRQWLSKPLSLSQGRQHIELTLPGTRPAGMYFYRITTADNRQITGKIILK